MPGKNKKNFSLALSLCAIAAGMALLAYAAAPLYSLFCRVTGMGGTTQVAQKAPDKVYERVITIRFNTDTDAALGWSFTPEQRAVRLKVGERGLASFLARNNTEKPETGTAIYNVTPHKAGPYFSKIQCFCFEKQTLAPHETMRFPVSFFVDPQILSDPNMKDVDTITLSYTFFPVKAEK